MGQNLSMPPVDTSGVKLSPQDRNSQIILGVTWLCCIYGIGMIFTAIKLMTRWAGPHGEKDVGFVSVVASFVLSVGWPVILVYLATTDS